MQKAVLITATEARAIAMASDPRESDPEINSYINKINEAIAASASMGYSSAHVRLLKPLTHDYQEQYLTNQLESNGYSAMMMNGTELFIEW